MGLDFESFETSILEQLESSPVPDLLADTTILPTGEQSLLISEHLRGLSSSLKQLQDIVRRSSALIDKLHTSRNLHRGLNSGMRLLPMEILSEIFCYIHTSQAANYGPKQMLAALPLSSVCRQWRHAALSCAQLWSALNLQAPTSKRGRPKGDLEWITEAIARSKGHPLTLTMEYAGPEESKFPPRSQAALDLIVRERHRWRAIFLYVEDGATLPPFVTMADAGPLPLLRVLDVCGSAKNPVEPSSYSFFHDTPNLISVDFTFAPPPALIPPSWHGMLVFKCSDTVSVLNALVSCPTLRIAKREVDDPRRPTRPEDLTRAFPDGKIVHENLRKFRLCFGTCRNEVLSLLSLPALEELALQDYERHDQQLLHVLPNFLSTSSRLRCLTLEVHLDVDDLPLFTNLLCNSLPVLEHLKLKEDNPPLSLITVERPFSLISCLLSSPGIRPAPSLQTLDYHMAVDDWGEYDTAQGETAIFCMICLAALEKVTEEVIESRFKQAESDKDLEQGMKPLKSFYVCADKVEGLERNGEPFFSGLEKFVKEYGLQLDVEFRESGEPGDPLFDDDVD